ncbi:type II toxin-antitoxin system CcdA family antitoxin [Candidatus Macondimonas diazotrophica]|uniref:Acetoacetyl-CoA synthase n=1 Tax=Candidatus Macondimonas diazotrophica TaxID=2305248 RepID=A0A4Z0FBI0_9GAMM|nr:type II toxin-antitoxin system CcdA family antitoxin [Candidatus Macondimonas diazotrophica]HBG31634.1 acetoacetyl-CoA synthase [Gammaproteobacteria bacterium]NCU02170.1 type II toxin-antitoxin system CcdA family antitoxin [Candidatus Macondimonas diazotrophica]TFZ83153.1 acetoacetyl-CoA synthase [Candidatus Macondimonas diazotrophica]HBG51896.1 acetoacetyl-CoA synthase [Gammaproteobacteria bacterium]HCO42829.1 acetoacetyl-CoA synthase [Gammaproteobacteria bacterium]
MATSDDHQTARRPANRSIYADLLAKVRDLKINLTATLEQALVERLRQRQREQWLAANRDAFDASNQKVETRGLRR